MDRMPQIPFAQSPQSSQASLFLNPDRRCKCVVVLDNSGSMDGARIDELNRGFRALQRDISADAVASKRVEIAVITFGPVRVAQPFTTVDRLSMPDIVAENDTPMGGAVTAALKLIEDRKRDYRTAGVPYFRPWMFLVTDGLPTDDITAAARAVRQAEASKSLTFFGVGVEQADMAELGKFSTRPPLKLQGLEFGKMFQWLSASLRSTSRSAPGQQVHLTNPTTGPDAWAVSA